MSKKEYKTVTAVIRVLDAKNEIVESEIIKIIDSHERREWLNKRVTGLLMWGLLNGKIIEIVNKDDDDKQ